jgi:hypothetical protein
MMKIYKLCLTIILVIFTSCTSEPLPFEPQHIEKITNEKDFMTRMLQQSVTRIPNGMTGALIHRNFMGQLYLVPTTVKKSSLSDECRSISDCLGVVYATVNKTGKEQGKVMYRVYRRGQSLNLDCTWVETYDLDFSAMNEKLIRQVKGRTQEWVNICFADK